MSSPRRLSHTRRTETSALLPSGQRYSTLRPGYEGEGQESLPTGNAKRVYRPRGPLVLENNPESGCSGRHRCPRLRLGLQETEGNSNMSNLQIQDTREYS